MNLQEFVAQRVQQRCFVCEVYPPEHIAEIEEGAKAGITTHTLSAYARAAGLDRAARTTVRDRIVRHLEHVAQ